MLSFAPAAPEEVGLSAFKVATWLFLALSESFSVFLSVFLPVFYILVCVCVCVCVYGSVFVN